MGDYNSDLRSEVNGSGRGVVSPHQFSIKNHGGTWQQKRDWQDKGEAFDLSSCAFSKGPSLLEGSCIVTNAKKKTENEG